MRVRMIYYISGGRHDGREWPQPGVPIEVPDWEGEDLVRGGHAVLAAPDGPAPQPLPGKPPVPSGAEQSDETAAGPAAQATQPDGAAGRVAEADAQAARAPAGNEADGIPGEPAELAAEPDVVAADPSAAVPGPSAAKQAWIEYAVTRGAQPQEAAGMTKADLMSRYGGRL